MKDCIEVIGPCSKWVDGKGWVTRIPIHLIENAGFVPKSAKEKAFWQGRSIERSKKTKENT